MDPAETLQRFEKQKTVLLTTYKRDGSGVGTPVNLAVEGGRAFFRTYDRSWKAKRLRRNQHVLVAPSTLRGAPTGDAISGVARLLDGDEARHAASQLRHKHPVLHGLVVPLMHRVRRYKTLHYEFSPEHNDTAPSQPPPRRGRRGACGSSKLRRLGPGLRTAQRRHADLPSENSVDLAPAACPNGDSADPLTQATQQRP